MKATKHDRFARRYLAWAIVTAALGILYQLRWYLGRQHLYIALFPALDIITSLAGLILLVLSIYVLQRLRKAQSDSSFFAIPIVVIAETLLTLVVLGPVYFISLSDATRLHLGLIFSLIATLVDVFIVAWAIYLLQRRHPRLQPFIHEQG